MMRLRLWHKLVAFGVLATFSASAEKLPDYDQDIKPLLADRCFQCHGPDKQKGGLRLDLKASALKGGASGEPAVMPGKPDRSNLLKLVSSHKADEVMPPKGEPLQPVQIALLHKWIETGAHWKDSAEPIATVTIESAAEDAPLSMADRGWWSFVPPVRVGEPKTRDKAWPRNGVDRFVLAAMEGKKLMPSAEAEAATLLRRVTYDLTGLPPTPAELDAYLSDSPEGRYERAVERLLGSPRFGERLASMWLPLARYAEDQAHQVGSDTKFFYPNAWKYREWVVNAFNRDLPYDRFIQYQIAADQIPTATKDDQAALGFLGLGPKYYNRNRLEVMADEWEDRVDTVTRTTLGLTVACARCHDHKFDPVSQRDYYALAGVFASTKMVNKTPDGAVQGGNLKAEEMAAATIHVVEDDSPKDLNLFIRGNVERKGPVVPRRFLRVLSSASPAPFTHGSGRLDLAYAITDGNNPLTARVMVNRLWGVFFGSWIVPTPSNFGRSGQLPSNPALLDYLATRFMDQGWSVKSMVREIVLSGTYRQSAKVNPANVAIDPANQLLWRQNRRRLTVEQWRDTVLFVAGRLDFAGGESMELDDTANFRRTLYARISRLKLNDLLAQFDYPDANVHAEKRAVTNTATQKLFVLNSPFMITQAKALAARVAAEATDDEGRVRLAHRMLFAREPSEGEVSLAKEFLHSGEESSLTPWDQYAQVLLASNEALYVD